MRKRIHRLVLKEWANRVAGRPAPYLIKCYKKLACEGEGAVRQVGEREQLGIAAVSHHVLRRVRVRLRFALAVIALSSLRGI
jgi:hypothetical protein